MLLVDKNIKELAKEGLLISKNYNEELVGAVSVDLTIDVIIDEKGKKNDSYELAPNSFIIIKQMNN